MLDPDNPFDSDESDELGIDYHVDNMGPEFLEPPEEHYDQEELGALSISGSVSGSASGGVKASGNVRAKKKKSKRKVVLGLIATIKAHGSLAPAKNMTDAGTKAEATLAKIFGVPKPQSMKALYALLAKVNAWLKASPKPTPKRAPTPATPIVTPRAPVPVVMPPRIVATSPVLKTLVRRKITPVAPAKVKRTVMLPMKGLRVRPGVISPIRLAMAKKRMVCHCPEEHVGDPAKKVVKLLAEVKRERIQREATSEHRGLMKRDDFRRRVLHLLRQCVANKTTFVGGGIRDKCRRTRVCT